MNDMNTEARKRLLTRRHAIMRLFQANTFERRELAEAALSADWVDRALADETSTVLQRLSHSEANELTDINAALGRIDAGTYGDCEQCGCRIGRQRLRAIPEARRCISCTESRTT